MSLPSPNSTPTVESYLKPEVIRKISRLDLRAQFVVKGFLQGLHASPYHGFSVEFSEHRKYTPGDDPKDLDWLVYAKTDKYYVKKFEAETNITGYVMVDASQSMAYTYRQELTKFDYAVSLAAALVYLMIQQQDPVGLVTFDDQLRKCVRPKSKRSQLGNVLSLLSQLRPTGPTNLAKSLHQLAGMLRHQSLVMLFSDLLVDSEDAMAALLRLKHEGHDVIVFHILDEAEVRFPFQGALELEDPESGEVLKLDGEGSRAEYLERVESFREEWKRQSARGLIDYVPLDTSMPFDRALVEYLSRRRSRF